MFSYNKIDKKERDQSMDILLSDINVSKSKIVIKFSLQTFADFTKKDESIQSKVLEIIEQVMINGSPAIISRGKKLIRKLINL